MQTTLSAWFSSISDLNLLSKLIRTGGPWVRIPLIPKFFQISSFLSKNSFYYFYNISYAQIDIFLLKCIVIVPKVRFRPIVGGSLTRAPIGSKINQCHFGALRFFVTRHPKYALNFGVGQKNNQCHGTVALARWAPLDIDITYSLIKEGPAITSSKKYLFL